MLTRPPKLYHFTLQCGRRQRCSARWAREIMQYYLAASVPLAMNDEGGGGGRVVPCCFSVLHRRDLSQCSEHSRIWQLVRADPLSRVSIYPKDTEPAQTLCQCTEHRFISEAGIYSRTWCVFFIVALQSGVCARAANNL